MNNFVSPVIDMRSWEHVCGVSIILGILQLDQTNWDQLELNYEADHQGWTIGDD